MVNGRHSNADCFQQKERTTATALNPNISNSEIVCQFEAFMTPSLSTPDQTSNMPKVASAATKFETQEEEYITYSAYALSTISKREEHPQFLLDTGANTHLTHDESLLHDIKPIKPVYINVITSTTVKVVACKRDTATISCTNLSGNQRYLDISNVLLVPEAGVNLIAVLSISNDGGLFSGNKNHIKIVKNNQNYVIEGVGADGL